jgi:hypothetical protein
MKTQVRGASGTGKCKNCPADRSAPATLESVRQEHKKQGTDLTCSKTSSCVGEIRVQRCTVALMEPNREPLPPTRNKNDFYDSTTHFSG